MEVHFFLEKSKLNDKFYLYLQHQQRYSSHSPSSPQKETLAFGSVQSGSTTSTISIRQSPSKDSLASNMSTKLERIFSESKSISNDIASKQFNIDDVDYKRVLTEFHKMISQMSQSSSSSNNDNNNNNNQKSQSGDRTSNSSNNNNNNNANSKTKRVTFSDHIVDFDQSTSDGDDADSQEMESTTASWSPSLLTTNAIDTNKNNNNNNNTDSTNPTSQMTREKQNFYMSFFQDALQKTYPALVKDSEPSMMSGDQEGSNFTSQLDDTPKATPASSSTPKGLGLLGPLTDKALDLIKTEKR